MTNSKCKNCTGTGYTCQTSDFPSSDVYSHIASMHDCKYYRCSSCQPKEPAKCVTCGGSKTICSKTFTLRGFHQWTDDCKGQKIPCPSCQPQQERREEPNEPFEAMGLERQGMNLLTEQDFDTRVWKLVEYSKTVRADERKKVIEEAIKAIQDRGIEQSKNFYDAALEVLGDLSKDL